MKLIKIRITRQQGGSIEKHVDARVWKAYQRTTRRTAGDSKWSEDSGAGSANLTELHDAQNCEVA